VNSFKLRLSVIWTFRFSANDTRHHWTKQTHRQVRRWYLSTLLRFSGHIL